MINYDFPGTIGLNLKNAQVVFQIIRSDSFPSLSFLQAKDKEARTKTINPAIVDLILIFANDHTAENYVAFTIGGRQKQKLRCYPEPRILPPFAGIIQIRCYECDLSRPFGKHLMDRTFKLD